MTQTSTAAATVLPAAPEGFHLVTCSCSHCTGYAAKIGVNVLGAHVTDATFRAMRTTKSGALVKSDAHTLVHIAHAPTAMERRVAAAQRTVAVSA